MTAPELAMWWPIVDRSANSRGVSWTRRPSNITTMRDTIAADMLTRLEGAEFNNRRIPPGQGKKLVEEAEALLSAVQALAVDQ